MDKPIRARHFTVVPDAIIDDLRVGPHGLLAYLAIRRHVGADGLAWPRRQRLSELMRCSVRTVDKALEELREYGYMAYESGKAAGKSNHYELFEVGGAQEVPRGCAGDAQGGAQEVRTEVDPVEVDPGKEDIAAEDVVDIVALAVAPRHGKVKPKRSNEEHEAFDAAWEEMAEIHGAAFDGKQEGPNLWKLIDFCRSTFGDDWKGGLVSILATAKALKGGAIKSKGDYWTAMPYTPSWVYNRRHQIIEYLRVKKPADAVEEYMR